jgi:hypothetical protein
MLSVAQVTYADERFSAVSPLSPIVDDDNDDDAHLCMMTRFLVSSPLSVAANRVLSS